MKKVLVSIVVPTYNVEDYIKECMDSLIHQTLEDIEIICVDNCSGDSSTKIIREEYHRDRRVKLIVNEKNIGMPVSRNVGLKNAVGKYVAFVDADDVCDLTMFEKLYLMAEKTDADITTCSVYRFCGDIENKQIHRDLSWYKEVDKAVPITERPQQLLEPAGWCKLFVREYIESIGFQFTPGSISCEDAPAITLAFLSTQKIAFVQEALYFYRFREDGNLTASMGRMHIDHYLWGMNRQKEIMAECGLTDEQTISRIVEFKYLMAFYILSKIGLRDLKYYFNNIIKAFSKDEFLYLRRLFEYSPKHSYLYRIIVGRHRYLYMTYRLARKGNIIRRRIVHVEDWEIYRIVSLFGLRIKTVRKKNAKRVYARQVQTINELSGRWNDANEQIDEKQSAIERLEEEGKAKQKRVQQLEVESEAKQKRVQQLEVESEAKQKRVQQLEENFSFSQNQLEDHKKYIVELSEALAEKAAYYKDVWCTGFIDIWKDYCNVHFDEIASQKQALVKDLDNESIDIANLLYERNINILPRQKYTGLFLYNHQEIYKTWELEGAKEPPVIDEVRGMYRIHEDVKVENAVFKFESGLTYLPPDVLDQIRGRDVIDGGAYWGDSALVIGKYTPKSIRSFEPSTKNYHKLLWTIENNELSSVVIPEKMGLGDKEDKMKLYTYALDSGANVLGVDPTHHDELKAFVEDISITTIDEYAKTEELDVGLIKLDVEGVELETIKGAKRTITLHKPILLISLYHNPKDFFGIKPMIESMGLGYRFMIRKLAYHDLVTEVVLIAYCEK